MNRYRVLVNRVVEEYAWIEVEAKDAREAEDKAEHESFNWPDWQTAHITDIAAEDVEES